MLSEITFHKTFVLYSMHQCIYSVKAGSLYIFFYIHFFTDPSVIVNGSCKLISPPSSSSEISITLTKSGWTNSTESFTSNSKPRSINQNDEISFPPTKHYLFFCNFFLLYLRLHKKN